jgi:Glycosyltransferase family 92
MNGKTKLFLLFLVIAINVLLAINNIDYIYTSKRNLDIFYNNENPEIIKLSYKNESIFIISAFYDSGRIRIVGAIHKSYINTFSNISCLFYHNKKYSTSDLSVTLLPEHRDKDYLPVYFDCNLNNYKYDEDYYVTIGNSLSNHFMKINNVNINNNIHNDKIAICTPPLSEDIYFETINIWLNYYKYIGIDKVIIYNMTAGKYTSNILKSYDKTFLEIYDWKFPSNYSIHYKGQILSIHDCLLRNSNKYTWILFIDFDEYIVLKNNETLKSISKKYMNANYNALSFRNTFHKFDCISDEFEIVEPSNNIYILTSFIREEYIFPAGLRSKCMVDTSSISIMGVHHAENATTKAIDPTEGLMHHVRYKDYKQNRNKNNCSNKSYVIDFSLINSLTKMLTFTDV